LAAQPLSAPMVTEKRDENREQHEKKRKQVQNAEEYPPSFVRRPEHRCPQRYLIGLDVGMRGKVEDYRTVMVKPGWLEARPALKTTGWMPEGQDAGTVT